MKLKCLKEQQEKEVWIKLYFYREILRKIKMTTEKKKR